jgi:hypothetical protein
MSALRVELFFDDEAGNWHYRVPALHINGGGTGTREMPSANAFLPSPSRLRATRRTTTLAPRLLPST